MTTRRPFEVFLHELQSGTLTGSSRGGRSSAPRLGLKANLSPTRYWDPPLCVECGIAKGKCVQQAASAEDGLACIDVYDACMETCDPGFPPPNPFGPYVPKKKFGFKLDTGWGL